MLLASAKAVILVHEIAPEALAGNMVWKHVYYPKTVRPEDTLQQIFDMNLNYYSMIFNARVWFHIIWTGISSRKT